MVRFYRVDRRVSVNVVTNLDEDTLFEYTDGGEFIEVYIDKFTQHIETDSYSVYDFDRMIFAEGEGNSLPGIVIWGAIHDFSKHIGLLSEIPADNSAVEEIQEYLQLLNLNPSEETINSFFTYLKQQYSTLTTIENHALIEIPDPTAPKVGGYPVVNVILYALPDGEVVKTLEATLNNASYTVDDSDSVYDHVSTKIPAGDIEEYADRIYAETAEEFEHRLVGNVLTGLTENQLEQAGYTKLKEEDVPEESNRMHAGKSATYWQKEIWNVDGIDATTGFSRIWFISDENIGVAEPSAGDFERSDAISRIRTELENRE